jgi:hypothetical protein
VVAVSLKKGLVAYTEISLMTFAANAGEATNKMSKAVKTCRTAAS